MHILMNLLSFCLGFFAATLIFLFLTLLPVKKYFLRKGRIKDAELACSALEQAAHDIEEKEALENEGKGNVSRIDTI